MKRLLRNRIAGYKKVSRKRDAYSISDQLTPRVVREQKSEIQKYKTKQTKNSDFSIHHPTQTGIPIVHLSLTSYQTNFNSFSKDSSFLNPSYPILPNLGKHLIFYLYQQKLKGFSLHHTGCPSFNLSFHLSLHPTGSGVTSSLP